jgi:oxaloacetate decarboxylase (Na+ extruding) subunit alpha
VDQLRAGSIGVTPLDAVTASDLAWGRVRPAAPVRRPIRIVDTTIRDGQGSLWATAMRTRHMVTVLPDLDRAGFDAIEFLAPGSRFRKLARELKEHPWEWIARGARLAERSSLRWHGTIDTEVMSGRVPPEVGELIITRIGELGIRETRFGNNWNQFGGIGAEFARYQRLGMRAVVSLMYSVSPRHTDEYFVAKAAELAPHAPYRICLKDVSGLLTPERARTLIPRLLAVTPGITWEFHGHCNSGLGPLNAIEAVEAGIEIVHTAVPPLADASSQPDVFALVANLRALGHQVDLDIEPLHQAERSLRDIAALDGFPSGAPATYRIDHYLHQIPGGMISNLRHQLQQAGVADRIPEVLEEVVRVRADFGYPIMVTPLSQFVGSQAAVNVISGSRYGVVTDSSIEYALGLHGGDEATSLMDQDVRDRILAHPRAREVAARRAEALPTLAELRARYGPRVPDEDLIMLAIMGDEALDIVGSFADVRLDEPPPQDMLTTVRRAIADAHERPVALTAPGLNLAVAHVRGPRQEA